MARSPLAGRYHSTVSSELIVFKEDEVRGGSSELIVEVELRG